MIFFLIKNNLNFINEIKIKKKMLYCIEKIYVYILFVENLKRC